VIGIFGRHEASIDPSRRPATVAGTVALGALGERILECSVTLSGLRLGFWWRLRW
jgi:hypothetical protein